MLIEQFTSAIGARLHGSHSAATAATTYTVRDSSGRQRFYGVGIAREFPNIPNEGYPCAITVCVWVVYIPTLGAAGGAESCGIKQARLLRVPG